MRSSLIRSISREFSFERLIPIDGKSFAARQQRNAIKVCVVGARSPKRYRTRGNVIPTTSDRDIKQSITSSNEFLQRIHRRLLIDGFSFRNAHFREEYDWFDTIAIIPHFLLGFAFAHAIRVLTAPSHLSWNRAAPEPSRTSAPYEAELV
jgi:hypothetical protein